MTGGNYAEGNLALPDQASFIIENTNFGNNAQFEANHHCNEGVTGVLCFPQYILHNVNWRNTATTSQWARWFQNGNTNQGGVFTLSPPNAQIVMDGGQLENNFFPPGFVSLASNAFSYLLALPGQPCVLSTTAYGDRYDGGILCRLPLRALKVYTQGLVSASAPAIQVEAWINGTDTSQAADSSQSLPFHQIGGDGQTTKQGYSLPVIPGIFNSYRLKLLDGNGDIPSSWVSDCPFTVFNTKCAQFYLIIPLQLGGRILRSSDRKPLVNRVHQPIIKWGSVRIHRSGQQVRSLHTLSVNHPGYLHTKYVSLLLQPS